MPELLSTLEAQRERDFQEKKFFAALKGVDLENQSTGNEWERLKARVNSKNATSDGNDIVSLQGNAAHRAGFGIGVGLDYEVIE
jgi:hypothetical protein